MQSFSWTIKVVLKYLYMFHLFTHTGSRHGRSAGHADVWRVLGLLQDDVSETGPVPADDGVQRQEGPPDSGRAGQLPAEWAEGERGRTGGRTGLFEATQCSAGDVESQFFMMRCPDYFQIEIHAQKRDISLHPLFCLTCSSLCLSCLPRGVFSIQPIHHAWNCFSVSVFSFVFVTHSSCSYIAICHYAVFIVSSLWYLAFILFPELLVWQLI